MSFYTSAREWLADHLAALVWVALALWTPPVVFTIGVDLSWWQPAGSGYLRLTDPSLMLAALQLTLMAAALPGTAARRQRSWQLLAAAWSAWCAHAVWSILVRVRLNGGAELPSWETLLVVTGPAIAAGILLTTRTAFTTGRPVLTWPTTRWRPRAGPLPGMK